QPQPQLSYSTQTGQKVGVGGPGLEGGGDGGGSGPRTALIALMMRYFISLPSADSLHHECGLVRASADPWDVQRQPVAAPGRAGPADGPEHQPGRPPPDRPTGDRGGVNLLGPE